MEVESLACRGARCTRLVPVLSDLNLHVEPGQRMLITGPSGSGKSTLLRAIAGLLTPALGELTGTTLLDGIPPTDCPGAFSLVLQDPRVPGLLRRSGEMLPLVQRTSECHATRSGREFMTHLRRRTSIPNDSRDVSPIGR